MEATFTAIGQTVFHRFKTSAGLAARYKKFIDELSFGIPADGEKIHLFVCDPASFKQNSIASLWCQPNVLPA